MREYKIVYLNEKLKWTRKEDVAQANEIINKYATEGWLLQEISTPFSFGGVMIAIMYKEK